MTENGNSWICNAGHSFNEPYPRYVMTVTVSDSTSRFFVSIYDEVGIILLG